MGSGVGVPSMYCWVNDQEAENMHIHTVLPKGTSSASVLPLLSVEALLVIAEVVSNTVSLLYQMELDFKTGARNRKCSMLRTFHLSLKLCCEIFFKIGF